MRAGDRRPGFRFESPLSDEDVRILGLTLPAPEAETVRKSAFEQLRATHRPDLRRAVRPAFALVGGMPRARQAGPSFVPMRVAPGSGGVVVELGEDLRVRAEAGFDAGEVTRLVVGLRATC